MKPLRLALLGFGRVAQALCGLIDRERERLAGLGAEFLVVAAASRTRGVACDPSGLSLGGLAAGGAAAGFRPWAPGEDGLSFAVQVDADVLVELTTLDATSGQPAIAHIEAALSSGKHVVTANKGPIAWDYGRLAGLAAACGRKFLFEATVMDGAPVFSLVRRCLPACRVTGIQGILNSTTNVILEKMGEGLGPAEALAAAQAMGVAEADPSLDTDGHDSAAKLAALCNVLMGAGLTPPDVTRSGIRNITRGEIVAAAVQGKVIKLLCEARLMPDGCVKAAVRPDLFPVSHPFASIAGPSSILTIQTDLLGELTIAEQSPGLEQTAYGVMADLLSLAPVQ